MIISRFSLPLLFALCASGISAAPVPPRLSRKQVIAYVFPQNRVLDPQRIAAGRLSRINYAFANIQDGRIIEGFAHDRENFAALQQLKRVNPELQVLVSVGGWSWSKHFSDVSLTRSSRERFIDSAVAFLSQYQLDGLDVDWEYPGMQGDGNTFRPEDRGNYTALLRELHDRFSREEAHLHRHLVLSVAVASGQDFLDHTDMAGVARYVDTVNLMAYDMYGDDKITGHHAPLFANTADPKHASSAAGVQRFLRAGVPRSKLVLGVPFYGKAWKNVSGTSQGLFQPGVPAHEQDLSYSTIVDSLLQPGSGYVRYWDASAETPFLYNAAQAIWVDYEDPESLEHKTLYVRDEKLAGIMFWQYLQDKDDALTGAIDDGLNHAARK